MREGFRMEEKAKRFQDLIVRQDADQVVFFIFRLMNHFRELNCPVRYLNSDSLQNPLQYVLPAQRDGCLRNYTV
jgi:hypothetical protein